MTTPVQIPYNLYTADGVIKEFSFTYNLIETADLIVLVDGELQTEYSQYTVEPEFEDGSNVIFVEPPADGLIVSLIRRTTMSQEVDYESYKSFPADIHEWNLDKITKILQELIGGAWGGLDGDGYPVYITFDLDAIQNKYTVTVTNTGGTNAELPPWVDATYAGVMHGEVLPEANMPADESLTTEEDGHFFIGI